MKKFYDEHKITIDELNAVIEQSFQNFGDRKSYDEKGAGSFCKFVKVNGKSYAVLSRRAEKLTFNALYNIMKIINARQIPVPILGGQVEENSSRENDFTIVMPEIEGINLPSYVYPVSKNITLIKGSESIKQSAFDDLAKECIYINGKSVHIDFHGGNFIFDNSTGEIRMIDLKRRSSYKDSILISKFIKLSAYDKLKHLDTEEVRTEIGDKTGVDIDFITAKNIVKSYIALSKAGIKEAQIAEGLKSIYGPSVEIDDFDKRC